MRLISLALALLFASTAVGQEKRPILPEPPVMAPAAGSPIVLTPDLIFIAQFDSPLIVLASPEGVVSITPMTGPRMWTGRFVDKPNEVQDRELTAKFLYRVQPITSGRVELLVIPAGATEKTPITRRLIDAQMAPQPPPRPIDPPKPIDPPAPVNPLPSEKLRVLTIYETADKLTAAQNVVLKSDIPQQAIKAAGGDYMCLDQNNDPTRYTADQWWKDAWKRKPASVQPPKMIISSPKGFYEGNIPNSVPEFEALIKKFI